MGPECHYPSSTVSVPKSTGQPLSVFSFVAQVIHMLRPRRGQALLILLSLAPYVVFITVEPLILKSLIDDAIIPRDVHLVTFLTAVLVGLMLLQALGDAVQRLLVSKVGAGITNDLRLKLFGHLQQLSLGFYSRARLGDLMSRFTTDMEAVDRSLTADLPWAAAYLLTILVGAAILFSIEWRMAFVLMACLPVEYVGPAILRRRAEKASYERQVDSATATATVQEHLGAQLVVKAFGLQRFADRRLRSELDQLANTSVRAGFLGGLLTASVTAGGSALLVLCIGSGSWLAVRGLLSPGSLVAFIEILYWMISSVQMISDLLPPLQRASAGMQHIQETLAETIEPPQAPDAINLPELSQAMTLDRVSFSYLSGETILRDVCLTIPAGKSVAIVGPSGCGKSTVLSLLMRFSDPTAGAVLLDGHDLRRGTDESLRRQIGIVFQENLLFDVSLRENIRLGRPDASDSEVEEAARTAEIHDFIASLPGGYDTEVGERGGRLSGGQRQRIALARALLRRPKLLLLDEATSALDPQTEAAINSTLQRLARDLTLVSVTHRLSSVQGMDSIVVLNDGQIVEQGTHDELIALDGYYHGMWRRQAGIELDEDSAEAAIEPV
jgi:ATP-binding cassette, subfamily B, bacterial